MTYDPNDPLARKRHDQHRAIADRLVAKWKEEGRIPNADPLIAHEMSYAMDTIRRAGHADVIAAPDGEFLGSGLPDEFNADDKVQHIVHTTVEPVVEPERFPMEPHPAITPEQLSALASEPRDINPKRGMAALLERLTLVGKGDGTGAAR